MAWIRLSWTFWLILLLVLLWLLPWEFYVKYITTPISIKRKEESALPTESPFPAITICNMNKVKGSLYSSLSSKDELKKFFIQDTCYNIPKTDLVPEEIRTKASQWKYYYYFQQQASQNCSNMIVFCSWGSWGSKHVDCRNWFKPVLTNKGLCCGFNIAHKVIDSGKGRAILDSKVDEYINWNPEHQFEESDPPSAIPRRIISNFTDGMGLGLHANISEYFCSENQDIGFEVMIHNPVEIPPFTIKNSFSVNPGKKTFVDIKPYIIKADQEVFKIDSDLRKCYFVNERKLRFYRIYTLDNCKLDCQANYTMEFCGCLPKHIPVDFNVKICGKIEEPCVSNMPVDYEDTCKCYRGCSMMLYDWEQFIDKFPNDLSHHKENLALLRLYYGNVSSEKYLTVVNDVYFRSTETATTLRKWLIALIVIVVFKIIQSYRSDFFPTILTYF